MNFSYAEHFFINLTVKVFDKVTYLHDTTYADQLGSSGFGYTCWSIHLVLIYSILVSSVTSTIYYEKLLFCLNILTLSLYIASGAAGENYWLFIWLKNDNVNIKCIDTY